ncbi:hypothetical protein J2Y03_004516 [Neobacillus niacini]|uniref:tripartite tricarboxylate transporter TctB family protein n=1 Tax=Neobacillus niacini TaxID=86668 RepID=UPI002858B11C|nr:tripartite tricarboxylate transporter TctB family protein [Neobacillus niacini]MDR7079458.1 hypothetical protein [Neobacillus niacini]
MNKKLITNISNAGLFLFCVLYLFFSFKMSIGSPEMPGPGFLPITLGVIGSLLSLGLLIKGAGIGTKEMKEKIDDFSKQGVLRFASYFLSIVLFLLFYKTIGLPMLFLLVFSLAKISGFRGWVYPILFAGIFTTLVYLLLTFLQIPFPSGIL